MQFPELHEDSVPTMLVDMAITRLVRASYVPNFSIKDLLKPGEKHVLTIRIQYSEINIRQGWYYI